MQRPSPPRQCHHCRGISCPRATTIITPNTPKGSGTTAALIAFYRHPSATTTALNPSFPRRWESISQGAQSIRRPRREPREKGDRSFFFSMLIHISPSEIINAYIIPKVCLFPRRNNFTRDQPFHQPNIKVRIRYCWLPPSRFEFRKGIRHFS